MTEMTTFCATTTTTTTKSFHIHRISSVRRRKCKEVEEDQKNYKRSK